MSAEAARKFAVQVVQQLVESGYQALWAGGCVRDSLRNAEPKDYDVATDATPQQVRELFGRRRTLAIGEQFGVIVVLGKAQASDGTTHKQQVEVATFRRDAEYKDGRRPTHVEFSSAEEDAKRRDFTVNGLFFDPIQEQIIDYVGGQRDLQQHVVRAIGDAEERFDEDKLRMLRAIRIATTLDFEIEDETWTTICHRPHDLEVVSAERIAAELRKILLDEHHVRGVRLLYDSGLLRVIFPETDTDTFEEHYNEVLASLRRWTNQRAQLAAGISDVQRESHGESQIAIGLAILFMRVAIQSEQELEAIRNALRRQKFTNREIALPIWLIKHVGTIHEADRWNWPDVQRLLASDDAVELLEFATAIHPDGENARGIAFCRDKRAQPEDDWNPQPLIDGHDLKQLGVPAGKLYREILNRVRDAQLMGECVSKTAALQMAGDIANSAGEPNDDDG